MNKFVIWALPITLFALAFIACGNDSSSTSGEINSSNIKPSGFYKEDCNTGTYVCVTTEYLNDEKLKTNKYDEFLDTRDNKVYKTITIGKQTWIAQNLNYTINDGKDSWCYDDTPDNCKKYGRLYKWEAAKEACPEGWRLPDNLDWHTLLVQLSAPVSKDSSHWEYFSEDMYWIYYGAVENLKTTSVWRAEEGIPPSTNSYGFSAMPAGYHHDDGEEYYFAYINGSTFFWSADKYEGEGPVDSSNYEGAYALVFYSHGLDAQLANFNKNIFHFSIRCLQD